MTKVKLPFEMLKDLVIDGYDVEHNGEKYVHVSDLG